VVDHEDLLDDVIELGALADGTGPSSYSVTTASGRGRATARRPSAPPHVERAEHDEHAHEYDDGERHPTASSTEGDLDRDGRVVREADGLEHEPDRGASPGARARDDMRSLPARRR